MADETTEKAEKPIDTSVKRVTGGLCSIRRTWSMVGATTSSCCSCPMPTASTWQTLTARVSIAKTTCT